MAADTDDLPPGVTLRTDTLLPDWAGLRPAEGVHDVWLVPALPVGAPEWDAAALLESANSALFWFGEVSRGKIEITATKVLPTEFYEIGSGNHCANARAATARAVGQLQKDTPDTTHIVLLLRAADCPFKGVGELPGKAITIAGLTESPIISATTLQHEMGHNLGLPHAAGLTVGPLVSRSQAFGLEVTEALYGDQIDVMGAWFRAGTPQLSAPARAVLGWSDGALAVDSDFTGQTTVSLPELSADGPDALTVDDPISRVRYMLTFINSPRPRLGVDVGKGVYLHRINYDKSGRAFDHTDPLATYLPWEEDVLGVGANAGTAWVSPTRALSIEILSAAHEGAEVRLTLDPTQQLTDTFGPAWPVLPSLSRPDNSPVVFLHVPSAWDQSVIRHYKVKVGKKTVTRLRPQSLRASRTMKLRAKRNTYVSVIAVDGAGNETKWSAKAR